MSRRPPDDVAQVILRALLAWPLLGAVAGVVLRTASQGSADLVIFALAAGLGAALAVAAAELAVVAGRRERAALAGGLVALALLAPAPLLGGEFGLQLLQKRSSAKATGALLARHGASPGALLDLDASLAVLLVGAALVVGRARGWPARTQAAAGAWLALAGAAGRLAAGRLEAVEVRWVLLVEVGLAVVAPYQVALADLAVRGARRLPVGRARPARVAGVLGLALAPALVVAAWALTLDQVRLSPPDLPPVRGREAAWAAALVVAALAALAVAHRRGASPRALVLAAALGTGLPAALLGRATPGLAGAFVVAALAVALLLPALALLLRRTKAAAGALVPRGAPGRPRAAVALALLLAAGLGAGWAERQGAAVRARVGLALGLDPLPLLRRAEGAQARSLEARRAGWTRTLVDLDLGHVERDGFAGLRRAAAERGDRQAILDLARTEAVHLGDRGRMQAWLDSLVAGGDLVAARHLLRWAQDDAARERAVARILASRRHDDDTDAGLAAVWEQCPERRAEVEAFLVAHAERWEAVAEIVRERGVARPGRALLRRAAQDCRREAETPEWDARLLEELLELDPTLLELDDLERLAAAHPYEALPTGWTAPLAGLDLGPLSPRGPALEAAARGDWPGAWSRSSAALAEDPADRDALRARVHVLLAVARDDFTPPLGPGSAPGPPGVHRAMALRQAETTLAALGLPGDAAVALDLALCDLHRLLGPSGLDPEEGAAVVALLEALPGFAEPPAAEVAARVRPLLAATRGAVPVKPALLQAARARLERALELAQGPDRRAEAARRRAAAALRAAR